MNTRFTIERTLILVMSLCMISTISFHTTHIFRNISVKCMSKDLNEQLEAKFPSFTQNRTLKQLYDDEEIDLVVFRFLDFKDRTLFVYRELHKLVYRENTTHEDDWIFRHPGAEKS